MTFTHVYQLQNNGRQQNICIIIIGQKQMLVTMVINFIGSEDNYKSAFKGTNTILLLNKN